MIQRKGISFGRACVGRVFGFWLYREQGMECSRLLLTRLRLRQRG